MYTVQHIKLNKNHTIAKLSYHRDVTLTTMSSSFVYVNANATANAHWPLYE